MSFDTDTFSLYQDGDPAVPANMLRHGGQRLVVTTTNVEEALAGWLHRIRIAKTDRDRAFGYAQYAETVEAFSGSPVLPLNVPALVRLTALGQARLNVRRDD